MIPYLSQFQFYSLGVVAANKKPTSRFIEVSAMEETPMFDGEITDHTEIYKAEGKSTEDEEFKVEIETTASIKAEWIELGNTNRMTAPDVRRGEVVAIYRFGDSDEYRWVDLITDTKLRRLETVVWSFSNMRKENEKFDAKTSYWVEVSTMKKYIHIHTSKNDDEPFEYDIQINTKDGCVTIKDDDGNSMVMDSAERRIELHNKDDSFLRIDKRIITLESKDKIILNTKDIEFNGNKSITSKTIDYTIKTTNYKLNTTDYKVNASKWKTDVPRAEFSNDIHVGGNQTTVGSSDNHHSH